MKRVLLLALFLLPVTVQAGTFARTQILMGDVPVSLTVEAKPSRRERAFLAMETAFEEARRLENSLSEWREGSQATRLNRNAGRALVPVDRDMMEILLRAREVSEMTGGAFDITFSSKRKNVSYRDVITIPELGLAYLRPGVTIGVSGITKGFIVDAMARVLRKAGFKRFLVDAGDLYAAGRWEIGIRDPDRPGGNGSLCEIDVKDQAVSTSGQYERGLHIVEPRTRRRPHDLKSVTVVAKDSTTADALATGLFVLGPQESERFLEKHPGIRAVFVRSDTSSPPRCAPPPSWRSDGSRRSWRRNRGNPSPPGSEPPGSSPPRDSRWASAEGPH